MNFQSMLFYLILLIAGPTLAQSDQEFDQASFLKKWLDITEGEPAMLWVGTYYEDGVSISLDKIFHQEKWELVKAVKYRPDRSYPATYQDLLISQRPFFYKKLPIETAYYIRLKNSPDQKIVLNQYASVGFYINYKMFDEKQTQLANDFQNDIQKLLPQIYKGAVLELTREGYIGFLKGVESYSYSWESLILDSNIKNQISLCIDGFIKNYDYEKWKKYGLPMSRGVLLYGPPGTGKSLIGKILATNALKNRYGREITFIYVAARHVSGRDSIQKIYEVARRLNPSIVFIEDIDLIAGTHRKSKELVKNELMQQLSGVEKLEGVITIGTTNVADKIDEALKRSQRLGYHFAINLPSFIERKFLFQLFLRKTESSDINFDDLSSRSEGMSGADIMELTNFSLEKAIKDNSFVDSKKIKLRPSHFEFAFQIRKETKLNFNKEP